MPIPRWVLAVVAAIASCGAVASCGANVRVDPTASTSVDPKALTGTVQFWDTSGPQQAAVMRTLVADFERTYPRVKVAYSSIPSAAARPRFQSAVESNTAPDVLRTEAAWTTEFASLGYLQPLDQTPLGKDTDEYLKVALASNEYQGQQFGVPEGVSAPAMLCNSALLRKSGGQVPTTWGDLPANAAKTKAVGAQFLYGPVDGYATLPYLYSQGGDLLDTQDKTIQVNNPPSVAGFQTALDLMSNGSVLTPAGVDPAATARQLFRSGRLACMIDGPEAVAGLVGAGVLKGRPEDLTVAKIPNGNHTGSSPVGGSNYVVYAGSGAKDASYALIEFINSQRAQERLANEAGLLPSRQAAYPKVTNRFVRDWTPVMDAATEHPWIPEWSELLLSMDVQWRKMYRGQVGAQQGADSMAQAWLVFLPKDYVDETSPESAGEDGATDTG
jgi:arabinogalactan oligomer/maltooligosaccharide transport system substrate-binding protein